MATLNSSSAHASSNTIQLPEELQLLVDRHVAYVQSLDSRTNTLEYWLTEHLRLNGLYWGLCALHLLKHPHALPRQGLLDFVFSCWHENGGFGAAPGHDPHMLYTVSAVQILCLVDGLDELDERGGKEKVGTYIAALQDRKTGTFHGDQYGEPDTRFLYGALNALSLLQLMHMVDVPLAVDYVSQCLNPDGGYGTSPGAETHSGQIFTCLGALSIASQLSTHPNPDRLAAWLSERQISSGVGIGGLNGRPEKREDVCYSWWVLSSLAMLKKVHWIDRQALVKFILGCQDEVGGGFSDRPGDVADVFHTVFGIAGLSLLGYEGLEGVDPVYCLPRSVVERALGKQ